MLQATDCDYHVVGRCGPQHLRLHAALAHAARLAQALCTQSRFYQLFDAQSEVGCAMLQAT